jgi:hypothetical protein
MSGIIGGAGSRSGVIGETEIDYETGEWTPVVADTHTGGNAATLNGTYNIGVYTKVGNICYINWRGAITSKGSMSGSVYIQGLPFQVATDPKYYSSVSIGYYTGLDGPVAGKNLLGFFYQSKSAISVYIADDTNAASALHSSEISATWSFTASGWFTV